uniref:Uncharacterized protein n=1 Tax=Juglanconis oblonga TaxID=1940568 RepID=A0A291LIM1_9PEZI|nr:hypothetical protein [Juglanconis oblonga]ATI20397.1 hypothetical protein [Juglanconis oblonga]
MWDSAQFHANSYTVSLIRAFFGMIKWTIVKYSGLKRGGYLSIVDKLTLLFYSSGLPLSSYLSFLGSGSGIYSIIRKCRMCRQFTQMGVYKCGSFIRTPPLTLLNHKKNFSTSCVRRNSDLAASSLKLSCIKVNSQKEFWKKLKTLDKDSPTQIVDNFFKNYSSAPQLAKKNISFNLIQSIFKLVIQSYDPSYKASTGTLSYTVNKGAIYKGTFKLMVVDSNKRTFSTLSTPLRYNVDQQAQAGGNPNQFHLKSFLLDLVNSNYLFKCSSKLAITFLILESWLNICLGFLVVFYRLRGSKKSLFHT